MNTVTTIPRKIKIYTYNSMSVEMITIMVFLHIEARRLIPCYFQSFDVIKLKFSLTPYLKKSQ